MTREDLLSALDLAPAPNAGPLDIGDDAAPIAAGPPPSPTALDLDDWSLRRGAEAMEGDILGQILAAQAGADPDHAAHVAADCMAAAFEPEPQLAENPADETRGRFFRQLLETEDYRALHAETRLDATASELAAGHFAQGFIALAAKEAESEAQQPQEGQPQTPGDKARQELRKDLNALSAAAGALSKATQDVDDLRDAQSALGIGHGTTGDGQTMDTATLRARFDKIRNSQRLRAIMALAGRYRRLAQAKQRQKTHHGQDDMIGVELGADLGRLLPSELAALADDDLQWDAMRRYLERGLLQRDYRGIEPKGQGPIFVEIDESGSMNGERIETAKAFALAMGNVAKIQRRWIGFGSFSGASQGVHIAFPPDKWDSAALLAWLEHFFNGGTDLDQPLRELPNQWQALDCPAGKTDLILITDAECSLDAGLEASFKTWKDQAQAKLFVLVLGEDSPGDLARVADRTWCLPDLSLEQEAIQDLMSI